LYKTEVLIVGGGVAGLSTAYFLAKGGLRSVTVLEQEKDLGGHASGRNAGMLRQALPDPVLASLAKQSRRYFEAFSGNGWKDLALDRRGSLLLAKGRQTRELDAIARSLKRAGIGMRWLSRVQAEKKVGLLRGGDFSKALFCPSDAMLELTPLLDGFLRSLRSLGVRVLKGVALEDVRSAPGGYIVLAGGKRFFAKKIVNAAGAWASWVALRAGASRIPLAAYRRHLFLSPEASVPDAGFKKWPFVWDVSHDFYFRPVRQGLLISPCDRLLEKKGDRREKTDPRAVGLLRKKMSRFSRPLGELPVGRPRSGLRTMTPDGRFVVGEDPARRDFYWVAGLGGHGVTTCFSVGKLAADMILGKKVDNRMKRALSPERFTK
jgi:D-arginine dehydrogenase